MQGTRTRDHTPARITLAWGVHLFTAAGGVVGMEGCRFSSENVLDREDFVEQLEFLLGDFLVEFGDGQAVEFLDVLEAVDHEGLEGGQGEQLVVVDVKAGQGLDGFDFGKEDVGVQAVVLKDDFTKVFESFEFVQVWMVDQEVEADVGQVHLFDEVVEFGTG